jgi:hypothetical protein
MSRDAKRDNSNLTPRKIGLCLGRPADMLFAVPVPAGRKPARHTDCKSLSLCSERPDISTAYIRRFPSVTLFDRLPRLVLASLARRSLVQRRPTNHFPGTRRCHKRRKPVFIGFGFECRELRIPPEQNDVCKAKESKRVKNVDKSYPGFPVFPRNDCGEAARRQSRENRSLLIVRRSQTRRLNFAFFR